MSGQQSEAGRLKEGRLSSAFLIPPPPPPKDEADFKDKLSPIVVSINLTLATPLDTEDLGLVLYGDTLVQKHAGWLPASPICLGSCETVQAMGERHCMNTAPSLWKKPG